MRGQMRPATASATSPAPPRARFSLLRDARANWQLHLLLLLPLIYLVVFKYLPMMGAQIAFRDFFTRSGIWGSPWVGLANFQRFFESPQFWPVVRNTFGLSAYQLAASFPIPIILALALNNVEHRRFKKTVQLTAYAPHFISTVVMAGMIMRLLSLHTGVVNNLLAGLGLERISFMSSPDLFQSVYVFSGIWQNAGYGTIIYLAALAGVDPQLHEAAIVDGATKLQRTRHIDVPGILPVAVILLILETGRIMDVGFEKAYLLQTPLNLTTSEVIQTYVYKIGLDSPVPDYSFATAVGLFNSVINLALILIVNWIARRAGNTSLW